jgi:uncharacterized protein (DUF2141 family)
MIAKIKVKGSHFFILLISFSLLLRCTSNEDPGLVSCENSNLSMNITTVNPSTCSASNGSITITPAGGISPYQYAMDAGSYSSNASFTGLGAGSYVLKIKDRNGCESATTVSLTSPNSSLSASIELTDSGCNFNNGSVIVTANGGTAPYTYQLNDGTLSSTNAFFNLSAGNYAVRVFDNTGCSITQTIKVLTGIKYSTDVKPIIDANCNISGCHDGTNVSFKVLANLQAAARDVKSRTQSGNMPKNAAKLPQADLDAIACWVDDGARDN